MDDRYGGPRADGQMGSYRQSNYRDHDNAYPVHQGYHQYPPPQQYPGYPPLPPGPPPQTHPSQMYHFGQSQQSNGYMNQPPPPPPQQFNFTSNSNLPSYPDREPSSNRYRDTRNGYERRNRGRDRVKDRSSYQRPVRMAANRPLLHTRRESTPDQLDGMQDDDQDNPKFRNIDTMSDSESEIMDESDSNEDSNKKPEVIEIAAPKWSNPEPYTSLPPPEASKKRRDVVKLIRKARIAAEKDKSGMTQLARNDDFISFGLEDENEQASDHAGHVLQDVSEDQVNTPIPNAIAFPVDNSIAERLASHKRKRSSDDIGDENGTKPVSKRAKTIKGTFPSGEILHEWLATASGLSTPWAGQHRWTENPGFRLHKEICDFYEFVKPCDFEKTMRLDLLNRIRRSIKKIYPECNVHAFGSFAAGLYLPDADLDLVVVSQSFATRGLPLASINLYKLSAYLVKEKIAAKESVEVIAMAKVPLIKFKDNLTGIRVDISFENLTGPKAVLTFNQWKSAYPAMPILVTLIKQFLMMRGFNEVVNGGIGGFTVTCLVTALLQNMPRVQSGELIPEQHLGEVLLEFLDLYGNQFDLYGTAIEMNPPRFVDKARVSFGRPEKREFKLHVVDPNDVTNDISGGSRNVAFIFKMFSYARVEILRALRSNNKGSVLEWMLGGNYKVYADQRGHLARLYKAGKWAEVDIDNEELMLNNLVQQTRNFRQLVGISFGKFARQASDSTKEKKTAVLKREETSQLKSRNLPAMDHQVSERVSIRTQTSPRLLPTRQTVAIQTSPQALSVRQNIGIQTSPRSLPLLQTNANALVSQDPILKSSQPVQIVQTDDKENKTGTSPRSSQTRPTNVTAPNPCAILAYGFATEEKAQNQFPILHRSHIVAVEKTVMMAGNKIVYRIIFDSPGAAHLAHSSRKGDAHMFKRESDFPLPMPQPKPELNSRKRRRSAAPSPRAVERTANRLQYLQTVATPGKAVRISSVTQSTSQLLPWPQSCPKKSSGVAGSSAKDAIILD